VPKGKSIKRYTAEELEEKISRGEDRTDWKKVDSLTDEDVERLIAEDPDERDIEWDWASARLVLPEPKAHINLRVDQDVLRYFKAQGPGYQTRINAVLRSYMNAHQKERGR
jgi:uncharacterized protein (DUF4415 family)